MTVDMYINGASTPDQWDGEIYGHLVDRYSGCCGEDVTEKLNALLSKVYDELMSSTDHAWMTEIFATTDGWDITAFADEGGGDVNNFKSVGSTSIFSCLQTVTYNGKCYKTTSLNYALWGVLSMVRHAKSRSWVNSLLGDSALLAYLSSKMITDSIYTTEYEFPITASLNKNSISTAGEIAAYRYHHKMGFWLDGLDEVAKPCATNDKKYEGDLSAKIGKRKEIIVK